MRDTFWRAGCLSVSPFGTQPTLFFLITQFQLSTVIYPGGKQLTVQLMEGVCLIVVRIWLKYWQGMLNFKIFWEDFSLLGMLIWLHHHATSGEQMSQVTAASFLSKVTKWDNTLLGARLPHTYTSIPLPSRRSGSSGLQIAQIHAATLF